MSKRSSYRSDQEDFEKYFRDDLSEQERHEMERRAVEDGFEAEAMEGWTEVPVDVAKTDLAEIRERLKPEEKSFNWFKIAAAVALLIVASWVVLNNFKQQPEMLAQDKSDINPSEDAIGNSITETSELPLAEETVEPAPAEEQQLEEINEPELETDLLASNHSNEPDQEIFFNSRTTTPKLQAKSEITEELTVANLDVSELDIVESEAEPPVQVLAAEGQDQPAVRFSPDEQVYSVTENDLFEIRSKDDWTFRQIQGNVLDEEGDIVSDARIVLDGTSILAVSDFSGKFEMAIPDSLSSPSLTFSSTGFNQLNYNIDQSDTFDVVMARDDPANFTTAFLFSRTARKRSKNSDIETFYDEVGFAPAAPEIGYKKYDKYLKKNTRTPEEAKRKRVKGTVLISMHVSVTGELSGFKIIRGLGAGCDEEAIRVVKEGPVWTPAKSGGESIEITTEIEIKFD